MCFVDELGYNEPIAGPVTVFAIAIAAAVSSRLRPEMRLTLTFASALTEVATSALTAASRPTMWTNGAPFDWTQLPMQLLADAQSGAAGVNKIAALTVRASAATARASGWCSPLTAMMSLEHRPGLR